MFFSSCSRDFGSLSGQQVFPRRLLLHSPIFKQPSPAARGVAPAPRNYIPGSYNGDTSFNANIVMILAVLLCALICALGFNSIIRCALRCSGRQRLDRSAAACSTNAGIKRAALKTFPLVSYAPELNLPGLAPECIICLAEFSHGEKVMVLPKCNHGFHAKCIDRWLRSHSTCPTCRQCLLDTCKKIVGCSEAQASGPDAVTARQSIIVPLEPEGLIVNYSS